MTNMPGDAGPYSPMPMGAAPMSPSDERTWAMAAHVSVLANLLTVLGGPIVALVIYFMYKDRSRYVAYHAFQAFIFQLVWWIGGGILAGLFLGLGSLLSTVLIGLLCIPFGCLFGIAPLASLVYGVIGGVQCYQGKDFSYWLIGDWVRGTLTS